MVITEKIDGTNAVVYIEHRDVVQAELPENDNRVPFFTNSGDWLIAAGSRTRWIKPGDDNFGFAKWVLDNKDDLVNLGPGRHYGEWWGAGIQRGYGLKEKRFSLFNAGAYTCNFRHENDEPDYGISGVLSKTGVFIGCCYVVPVLYSGPFTVIAANLVMEKLSNFGSRAAPGFMKPEGIIVYHEAARSLFKLTIEKDEGKDS